MSGWEAVRRVQQMCDRLKANETKWSTEHFQELKSPRWLLLTQTQSSKSSASEKVGNDSPKASEDLSLNSLGDLSLNSLGEVSLGSFWEMRPKLFLSWKTWLDQSKPVDLPPAALLATPAPLGQLVLNSILNPAQSMSTMLSKGDAKMGAWVEAFGKKPLDIQFLAWLHILTPKTTMTTTTTTTRTFVSEASQDSLGRDLWNMVTVLQNSPLPFALRARLTVAAYDKSLPIPIPATAYAVASEACLAADEKRDGLLPVSEWTRLAERGGVLDHWLRSLWESSTFASTDASTKSDIRVFMQEKRARPTEPPSVYDLLSKLDQQVRQIAASFFDPLAIISRMLHVTNVLSVLQTSEGNNNNNNNDNIVVDLLTHLVHPVLEQLPSKPTLQARITQVAKLLHLQSLMSVGQMRRAVASFWTLLHAISK